MSIESPADLVGLKHAGAVTPCDAGGRSSRYHHAGDHPLAAHYEQTVFVTPQGAQLLTA